MRFWLLWDSNFTSWANKDDMPNRTWIICRQDSELIFQPSYCQSNWHYSWGRNRLNYNEGETHPNGLSIVFMNFVKFPFGRLFIFCYRQGLKNRLINMLILLYSPISTLKRSRKKPLLYMLHGQHSLFCLFLLLPCLSNRWSLTTSYNMYVAMDRKESEYYI